MSDSKPSSNEQVTSETPAPQHQISDMNELKSSDWSRVSALAIIYFFAKTVYLLARNFIFALPVLAFNFSTLKENPAFAFSATVSILFIIFIISLVHYVFYQYRFTDGRVEIKQGAFNKVHLDLPFHKIQNVKIVQPIYYRYWEYAYLELDTAGSAQQEAKIVALPLVLAQKFKGLILRAKQEENNELSDDMMLSDQGEQNNSRSENETVLNKRSLSDLIVHGVSNNRVWIVLGFLAPFYNSIVGGVQNVFASVGLDLASYLNYQSQSVGLFILHALSLVMLIMLVMVSFSVLASIFVFYQYTLCKQGDRYIRRSGLLSKHEVSMRLSRIQIAIQQQDWLDVIIKRVNLRFEQNTSVASSQSHVNAIHSASKLLVPSVTPNESIELIQDAFDVKRFAQINFCAISKRFIIRQLLFLSFPILLLSLIFGVTIVGLHNEHSLIAWCLLALLNIAVLAFIYLRWRRWGYYFDGKFVYIRKGLFGVNYYVFPMAKTQQVCVKQSLFMRKHKLANLQFVLASGSYTLPFISDVDATKQAECALMIIAKYKPAWM